MQETSLNAQIMLNKKDEEIATLVDKIKRIDTKCLKYEEKLEDLMHTFKEEYDKKSKQVELLKNYYETMIDELQGRLNEGKRKDEENMNNYSIPHRENENNMQNSQFKQNNNSFKTPTSNRDDPYMSNKNISRGFNQDEEIRKKINNQLNSVSINKY